MIISRKDYTFVCIIAILFGAAVMFFLIGFVAGCEFEPRGKEE